MKDWQDKLADIADEIGTDDQYAMQCIIWCVGTLNLMKKHELLADGAYTFSEKGDALYSQLQYSFKPSDFEIATTISTMVAEDDLVFSTLLLSTYRDIDDEMLRDYENFKNAYKYN